MNEKSFLTTWEAGRYSNLSPSTIKYWVNKGRLPAFRTPGGHIRINIRDLDRFLLSRNAPLPMSLKKGGKRLLLLVPESMSGAAAKMDQWADRLNVLRVSSGFDAGLALFVFKPHFFLVDLDSSAWQGKEICKRVLNSAETADVKVLAMTSTITVEQVEEIYSDGVLECFSSPPDPDELKTFLKRLAPYCGWTDASES